MGPGVMKCAKQNKTVDIYEDYFLGEVLDHSTEPPSAKGLAVLRDPNEIKRAATSIDWHPHENKIAVSYSVQEFQDPKMTSGSESACQRERGLQRLL